MKRQGKVIIAILLVILIAVFALMNTEPVPIHFGFTTVSWPLVLILLVAIFLGAILMFLFATISNYQTKRTIKRQADRIQTLETRLGPPSNDQKQVSKKDNQTEVKDDKRD